ncbi:uncharacterized protein TRIADDRAFT_23201, partial [Trichoplax adhaerens]
KKKTPSKKNKRLSVERIYQKKSQLEHILLRPDTYIGSVEHITQTMWVIEDGKMMNKSITYPPGLYKIFDEILVNAADNKQRDPRMDTIKITIDPENNLLKIWNNGRGIPVEIHREENVYVPTLIFGHLLTSSNYNDDERKVTGGRNGYGAKLCNIFSTEFKVETYSADSGKQFSQTWNNNMSKAREPKITAIEKSKQEFTCITFKPDLQKFGLTHLTSDIVSLMTRRAYDIAAAARGVKVYLNGDRIPIKTFKDYVELFLANEEKDDGEEDKEKRKITHEIVNGRWEVCLTASDRGFQQASFVNSIATTKGGTHVNHVVDQLVEKLMGAVKKKNKGGIDVKPYQIKNHMWVFINCLIENPSFDSQTKENMTLRAKSFGSSCNLSEKFIKGALGCGVVERILNWVRFKTQAQLSKKCSASKHSKLKGIPKLDDANDAGTRNSSDCTLILTEGDSAKALAVSGLSVVGRDKYGVFPLRGKLLNTREASSKQVMENAEINNIIKILGLHYNKKYNDDVSLKSLRYGNLMIMADQDQDGSHIKGLLINFIHHNWPSLLQQPFLKEFITPIVKVTKGKNEIAFYSIPEFEEWKQNTASYKSWKVKYYKGLGTSTPKEAKEYFADMSRHRVAFRYDGNDDDTAIQLAFSKKMISERKEWLNKSMEDKKNRKLNNKPEPYLYGKEVSDISYSDFVNKELIHFSNADNIRSIPSLMDGLKPGQRKVLFTCFKRNDKKDIKVAQLAGSVAEMSAYHHGEASLMGTIINLAQNFVGSNNINLLQPIGQFGTRLHGGKDSASARYIFTMLSPVARYMFDQKDEPLLEYQFEDNLRIEPDWYAPLIPVVLVNGAEGIGTGYSTRIPNYNPREIVDNLKRLLAGEEPIEMHPWYKNFKGEIKQVEENKYQIDGVIKKINETTLEIVELPIRTWTQAYKEGVLEPMLHGGEKTPSFISNYKEYHTDTTVRFIVTLTEANMEAAEKIGLLKKFKLEGSFSTNSMVLFDAHGCLRRYGNAQEILKEFYETKLEFYVKRKEWLEGLLEAESRKLSNQARFILEKIDGKLAIENKSKRDLIAMLKSANFDSDPVKSWQNKQKSVVESEESDASEQETDEGPDFNYILNMNMWSLTKERKDELIANKNKKIAEYQTLKEKTPKMLWLEDIEVFLEELEVSYIN